MGARNDNTTFRMFIGYNSTGKSSVARMFANLYHQNNPQNTIAGYDPQNRFKDLLNPKYKLSMEEKGWWMGTDDRKKEGRYPLRILRNALFVGDDYRGINRAWTMSKDLAYLMEFRMEYGIDSLMVCHSPALVLEGLTPYISHYHIFYTKGKEDKFEAKMENYVECQRANELIKEYVRWLLKEKNNNIVVKRDDKGGPGQFYDEKNGKHTFPHIVVDTTTSELLPMNLDPEWLRANSSRFEIEL